MIKQYNLYPILSNVSANISKDMAVDKKHNGYKLFYEPGNHCGFYRQERMDKKILVVFYSRTGVTKKVAETISGILKCDIDEIIDKKNRNNMSGYLLAGRDATLKKFTEIETLKNPSLYDVVIIGTPVWAFTVSSAVRTYINTYKDSFKKVGFFCTMGGSGAERTFREMESLCSKKPLACMACIEKQVKDNTCVEQVKKFAGTINI